MGASVALVLTFNVEIAYTLVLLYPRPITDIRPHLSPANAKANEARTRTCTMSGPDWKDVDSAKRWLEQRFVGSAEAGSPLYQHLIDLGARGLTTDWREEHLSTYELMRWITASNITGGIRYTSEFESITFYPGYRHPAFSADNEYQQSTNENQERSKAHDKSPWGKKKGGRAKNQKSSSQQTTQQRSKDLLPAKETAKKRQSRGARHIDPKAMGQLEARVKTLRPRLGGRKHGKTGKTPLQAGNAIESN